MVTGAAPISPEVLDFMKVVSCVPIMEGYGLTETTGSATLSRIHDGFSGHVGGPMANCELKYFNFNCNFFKIN